jgi:hypothetical protein
MRGLFKLHVAILVRKSTMLSMNLIGAASEYYVCAELCRRRILALVTPKNNKLIDVLPPNSPG